MNNPLLREFILAYQTQNLRPIRRCFFFHDDGGDFTCPLVALAIHRGQVEKTDPGIELDGGMNTALEWAARTFGEAFTMGILDGFDGRQKAKADSDYLRGFALGVAAAQQLSPRDPAV